MRENPRPTRHLEHVEPEQFGEPVPGSLRGPAWDLVPLPDPMDPRDPLDPQAAGGAEPPGDALVADPPAPSGDAPRKRPLLVVAGAVLGVLVLGIGGLVLLGELRPEGADDTTAVERTAVELPYLLPDRPVSDRPTGPARRAESQPRPSGAVGADGGAVLSPPSGTVAGPGTRPGEDATGEGAAGTGTEGGTGSSTGGTGSSGGGSTTPTAAPPPTSDPTTKPTTRPTPEPTASATGEPTPDPTPSPSVSPTPEPTGAPVTGA